MKTMTKEKITTKEIRRFKKVMGYEPVCLDCEFYRGIVWARYKNGDIKVNNLADAFCTKLKGLVECCDSKACEDFSAYDKDALGE
jgi:hypothetical protein